MPIPATTIAVPTVLDVDLVGDLTDRRHHALAAAREDALGTTDDDGPARAGLGLRRFGPGCLALALRGTFDAAAVARVRSLDRALRRLASTELVLDCSVLDDCDRALARALAQLRIRCLVAGATVELHHTPPLLSLELGQEPRANVDVPATCSW